MATMMTPKEVFLATVKGQPCDRYSKQFEALVMPWSDPFNASNPFPWEPGTADKVDFRGITWSWPAECPGAYPLHGDGVTVLEDIEDWRSVVKNPPLEYADELWAAAEKEYAEVDRSRFLVGPVMFPGLFETLRALMGMEESMVAFYTNPDEVHEIIDYLVEWEMAYVRQLAEHLHPDFVFHHDDWGSDKSTFISPEMFAEFFLDPYKRLYGCYKENGFDLIIHHSDSYAATLVPYMIEMGVDVWQGGTESNDIPALIREYGGQISFMTGVDSQIVDVANWSEEAIESLVECRCEECGTKFFIPCQTQGGAESIYPGVAEAIDRAIDKMSAKLF